MRRLVLLVVAASALAGCGRSECQELGERICGCQPGLDSSTCQTQVESLLNDADPGDAYCRGVLAACNAPEGQDLCQWMLTEPGRQACGLATP